MDSATTEPRGRSASINVLVLPLVVALMASVLTYGGAVQPAQAQGDTETCGPDENAGPYGAFIPNGWGSLNMGDYIVFADAMDPGDLQSQFEDPLEPPGVWVTPHQEFKVCFDSELGLWIVYHYETGPNGATAWVPVGGTGSGGWNGVAVPPIVAAVFDANPVLTTSYWHCLQEINEMGFGPLYCDLWFQTSPLPPSPGVSTTELPDTASFAALVDCPATVPGAAEAAALEVILNGNPADYGGILGDSEGGDTWLSAIEEAEAELADQMTLLPAWLLSSLTALVPKEPDFEGAYRAVSNAGLLEEDDASHLLIEPFSTEGVETVGRTVVSLEQSWWVPPANGGANHGFLGMWQINAIAETGEVPAELATPLAQAVVNFAAGNLDAGWDHDRIAAIAVGACGASALIAELDGLAATVAPLEQSLTMLETQQQSSVALPEYVWCESEGRPTIGDGSGPKTGAAPTTVDDPDDLSADVNDSAPDTASTGTPTATSSSGVLTAGLTPATPGVTSGPSAKGDAVPVLVAPDDATVQSCFNIRLLHDGRPLIPAVEWVDPDNHWATNRWWSADSNHPNFSSGTVVLKFLNRNAMHAFEAAIEGATPDQADALIVAAIYGLNPNQFGQTVPKTAVPLLSNGIPTQLTTPAELHDVMLQLWRDHIVTAPDAQTIDEVPIGSLGPPELYVTLPRGFSVRSKQDTAVNSASGIALDALASYGPRFGRVALPLQFGRINTNLGHPSMTGVGLSFRDSFFDWLRVYSHEAVHAMQHHAGTTMWWVSDRGAFATAAFDTSQEPLAMQFFERNMEAPAYRVSDPVNSCALFACTDTSNHTFGLGSVQVIEALTGDQGHPLHFAQPFFDTPLGWVSRPDVVLIEADDPVWSAWFLNLVFAG